MMSKDTYMQQLSQEGPSTNLEYRRMEREERERNQIGTDVRESVNIGRDYTSKKIKTKNILAGKDTPKD